MLRVYPSSSAKRQDPHQRETRQDPEDEVLLDANEILIVGADADSRYFEKNAKDDPEFMLLLVSKARINGISEEKGNKVKQKLMRDAWRPDVYKSE